MNKTKIIIIAVVAALLLIVAFLIKGRLQKAEEDKELLHSLNAKLQTWKNKDSLNMAKIQVIETQKTKNFLALETKDQEIKDLQKLVKDYEKQIKNGSATIIKTETAYVKESIIKVDTICGKCSFTYVDTNPWVSATISVTPTNTDSLNLSLDYKIKNEYHVVIGEEKQSLFKKKPFVEITNLNPYTETTSLRTYQVANKEKKFGLGIQAGYGINHKLSPGFYIGIGVHYSLIRF